MNHHPKNEELLNAKKYLPEVVKAHEETKASFPLEVQELLLYVAFAIPSRETFWGYAHGYKPLGTPAGTGDGGHGHGFYQIDDRSHRNFLKTGKWKDVYESAKYAIQLLSSNRHFIMVKHPKLIPEESLWCAIAGYNCGMGNVYRAMSNGWKNSIWEVIDKRTAGRDYAHDIKSLIEGDEKFIGWQKWVSENFK